MPLYRQRAQPSTMYTLRSSRDNAHWHWLKATNGHEKKGSTMIQSRGSQREGPGAMDRETVVEYNEVREIDSEFEICNEYNEKDEIEETMEYSESMDRSGTMRRQRSMKNGTMTRTRSTMAIKALRSTMKRM
eukprot:1048393-Amphidinium_carterae.1